MLLESSLKRERLKKKKVLLQQYQDRCRPVSYVRSPDGMTAEEHTLHVRRYIWDICSIYIDCILDPVNT